MVGNGRHDTGTVILLQRAAFVKVPRQRFAQARDRGWPAQLGSNHYLRGAGETESKARPQTLENQAVTPKSSMHLSAYYNLEMLD